MGCEFAFALSFFISYIWMPSKKYLSLSGNINWRLSIISVKNKRSFIFLFSLHIIVFFLYFVIICNSVFNNNICFTFL